MTNNAGDGFRIKGGIVNVKITIWKWAALLQISHYDDNYGNKSVQSLISPATLGRTRSDLQRY